MRVLFVNNDANSAADTCSQLDKHCLLDVAHNGEEGVYLSQVNDYAAIVVESDPGDVCNADLCRYTREEDQKTPIIVLLEEGEVENKLEYLDCGADAVLTKPVDSVLVMAYLRNLIKRAAGAGGSNVLKVGDLCLDMENKRVSRERQDIQLSRKEYELLEFLMLPVPQKEVPGT